MQVNAAMSIVCITQLLYSITIATTVVLAIFIVAASVQFNFSTPELAISEGGDLPSQLSIVKTGQHQGNITVDIALTSTFQNQRGMCGGELL